MIASGGPSPTTVVCRARADVEAAADGEADGAVVVVVAFELTAPAPQLGDCAGQVLAQELAPPRARGAATSATKRAPTRTIGRELTEALDMGARLAW
ncbi:MAG: hypothetical protein NVSMB47_02000 [Polyangiales bacterium]